MRPLGPRLRESVPVRGTEKRHEEDTEKRAKEQAKDAREEQVFHARHLRRDWLLRSRAIHREVHDAHKPLLTQQKAQTVPRASDNYEKSARNRQTLGNSVVFGVFALVHGR